jgi:hypothetical protein
MKAYRGQSKAEEVYARPRSSKARMTRYTEPEHRDTERTTDNADTNTTTQS